jgi:nitric oxide reductase subunit C
MLSKSQARLFFIVGTIFFSGVFLWLTIDTMSKVPAQTNSQNISESVNRGKHLWEDNNCMGCHTIFGEGAYYAPELTKVYERRGEGYIKAALMSQTPWQPRGRKMVAYGMSDADASDLVAFLKWAGEADLSGFPAKPPLKQDN